jgi:hypothetical protein
VNIRQACAATGSPIAAEALRRIAELYAIEASIRGRTAEERRGVRNSPITAAGRADETLAQDAAWSHS